MYFKVAFSEIQYVKGWLHKSMFLWEPYETRLIPLLTTNMVDDAKKFNAN